MRSVAPSWERCFRNPKPFVCSHRTPICYNRKNGAVDFEPYDFEPRLCLLPCTAMKHDSEMNAALQKKKKRVGNSFFSESLTVCSPATKQSYGSFTNTAYEVNEVPPPPPPLPAGDFVQKFGPLFFDSIQEEQEVYNKRVAPRRSPSLSTMARIRRDSLNDLERVICVVWAPSKPTKRSNRIVIEYAHEHT